jgi:hypothetical protein
MTAREYYDEIDAQKCGKHGALPLPNISAFTRVFDARRGEGWGEGVTAPSRDLNPSPHPSPYGRGSRSSEL